jgi:hypothetical protein
MDVLGLVAILEDEVLEKGVGGERGGEEVGGEVGRWIGEDRGLGGGEEESASVVMRRHCGRN